MSANNGWACAERRARRTDDRAACTPLNFCPPMSRLMLSARLPLPDSVVHQSVGETR